MKEKKPVNLKTLFTLNLLCAVCWFIAAIINAVSGDRTLFAIYLCLGSAWLSIAALNRKKWLEEKEKDEE